MVVVDGNQEVVKSVDDAVVVNHSSSSSYRSPPAVLRDFPVRAVLGVFRDEVIPILSRSAAHQPGIRIFGAQRA